MKIAVFYHCLFYYDDPPDLRPMAFSIVSEQMAQLERSGLLERCDEFVVGVNGGEESKDVAHLVIPAKARLVFHGLESKAENLTIVEVEKFAPQHPEWLILYFHAKGCTHPAGSSYGEGVSWPWRRGMMSDLIDNWRTCVADLETGQWDIACSHFMWNMADGSQHIPAGNFLWVTANFVATLPSIFWRERIRTSGIAAKESRFEAEVYWGNGPRKPRVRQYRPNGGGGVP